jgi:hypothetical protein
MVEVEDVEGIVMWTVHVADAPPNELDRVLRAGRATAEENSYEALRPLWRALLSGFVTMPESSEE